MIRGDFAIVVGAMCVAIGVALIARFETLQQKRWVHRAVNEGCQVVGFAGRHAQPVWSCPGKRLQLEPLR